MEEMGKADCRIGAMCVRVCVRVVVDTPLVL